jgi:hypothetical protein
MPKKEEEQLSPGLSCGLELQDDYIAMKTNCPNDGTVADLERGPPQKRCGIDVAFATAQLSNVRGRSWGNRVPRRRCPGMGLRRVRCSQGSSQETARP